MGITTAVVLAGGKGLRLSPYTEETPKPMIRVGGRPLLEHVLRLLKSLGITTVHAVVAYKQELIREYFGDGRALGLDIRYIDNTLIHTQAKSGLSDAVLLAEGKVSGPFITILGDEVYIDTDHAGLLKDFEATGGCECIFAVHETDDREAIKKNYAVTVDGSWNVLDLEEKPQNPAGRLLGCGTYLFTPSVFDYIRNTPLSPRSGRKELADTMKAMIRDGRTVKAHPVGGRYLNINYTEDLRTAERYFAETKKGEGAP